MIRRPPRSTRTDTLLPYTTLCRSICKAVGEAWYEAGETALLLVLSIPARLERNILINPNHPQAEAITTELPEPVWWDARLYRSEEHTSELQSLMRISYAVFCLKKKKSYKLMTKKHNINITHQ